MAMELFLFCLVVILRWESNYQTSYQYFIYALYALYILIDRIVSCHIFLIKDMHHKHRQQHAETDRKTTTPKNRTNYTMLCTNYKSTYSTII